VPVLGVYGGVKSMHVLTLAFVYIEIHTFYFKGTCGKKTY